LSTGTSYRAQAKLIVSLFPGIHVRRLQKLLGASFSTTRHHVGSLERDGEIVRAKDGRYDRLYPFGTDDGMRAVYAILQSKTSRKILQTLADSSPGVLTNGDLSELTRIPRSTVSECIARMSKAALMKRSLTFDGRITYEIRDKDEVLRLLAAFRTNILNMAADRFIDLWEI
jgi:predicted transcriptional regulator